MKSLRKIYNLSYDTSGFNSGLINWYNQLIDKSYDNLDIADVCKMIRQDVLRDVAIKKAIELFLNDPYDGEYNDGGLLNLLVALDINSLSISDVGKLKIMLKDIEQNYTDFEWSDEETKTQYAKNIDILLRSLESVKRLDENDK